MSLSWMPSSLDDIGAKGAELVSFAGGFQICVCNLTKDFKPSKTWRISWDGESPPIAFLRRPFKTRGAAKRAVEKIFVPIVAIAPRLVTATVAITAGKLGTP